jgi:hypothetical protein
VTGTTSRPNGSAKVLVLQHAVAVCRLAAEMNLQVLGVTDRGRLLVTGPMGQLSIFTARLQELLGEPVEVLPAGLRDHVCGDHDLARVTPVTTGAGDPPGRRRR